MASTNPAGKPRRPFLERFPNLRRLAHGGLRGIPFIPQASAVDCGAAHGALAMTTPGDTTMVSLAEVERVMKGGSARVQR